MRFRDDERAQSVQIGAVLLFAVLIVAFSGYQAVVVPDQNRRVEISHSEAVQQDLQDLRNAIVSLRGGGSPRSTSVALGAQYPTRAVAVNPGPPSGTLRTIGTGDDSVAVSVRNATASGETGDLWNGSAIAYDTGGLAYDPTYNLYSNAPLTVYEHSVLYNEFPSGTLTLANQTVVDGRTISIVTLNGSLARSSASATSVDVRPVSASTETVFVRAADSSSPVTITLSSRLPVDRWRRLLSDQERVTAVEAGAGGGSGEFAPVRIELEPGVGYRLQLTKVGLGSDATREGAAYLTDVGGEGATVRQGNAREVTLAVRDRYNNPVANASVRATVDGSNAGTVEPSSAYTGADGTVTFEYETSGATDLGTHQIDATIAGSEALAGSPFDQSTTDNVTVNVTVQRGSGGSGGSSGAYSVGWKNPALTSGNGDAALSSCTTDSCTWDVGASGDATLDLNATLSPPFEGVDVEFAVSDSSVGTLTTSGGQTGSSGSLRTGLSAQSDGSVTVLASANDGSDVIDLRLRNVGSGSSATPTISHRVDDLTRQQEDQPIVVGSYNVSNVNGSFERVDVTFDHAGGGSDTRSSTATRAGFRYSDGFGAGDEVSVTYDVIYTDAGGTEYVAASETVTDVADARNPSGNADLAEAGTAALTDWQIDDRTQTNQNRPRYRYSYTVSNTGGFSGATLYALNLPGAGASTDAVLTTRSANNEDVRTASGAFDDYRVGILVRDANGAVVDVVSLTDTADGTGAFAGP